MSSKQEDANLILKLYELRREETMRQARNWFFDFNPQSAQDIINALMGEHSAYYRMVTSYWDMAAALVKHGAISMELFNDTQGEHFAVFAQLEKLIEPARAEYGPHFRSRTGQAHSFARSYEA